MKFLFDLFPVILFFIVFKWGEGNAVAAQAFAQQYLSSMVSGTAPVSVDQAPILLATAVAILATIGQIVYLLIRRRKVDGMLWMSFFIIGIFGGATIYFHNDAFIKWKPTALYWCFTVGLIGSQLIAKKNVIRIMLEKQIALPAPVWSGLNWAWAGFFALMGVINLVIAFRFSTDVWVNFKLFGGTGLMLIFVLGQTLFLSKYMKDKP